MTSTPRTFVFFLLCCSAINLVLAQDLRPIGTWKDHLNYRSAAWLTQSQNEVIVSTGTALIYIDKQDGSHTTVSKVDDLSESQLAQIKYDKVNGWLIVVYNSGAFDLLGSDEKYYITSIKDNNVVAGSKAINDICLTGDKYAYFATSFGIIEYDLQRIEFRSTTFTNKPVSSITADNQYIYAALDDGIYRIARNDNSKENFSRWQWLDTSFGLPDKYEADLVEVFNNQLYATVNGKLMVLNNKGQFDAIKIQFEPPLGM